jgi:GNAT superfamily N-acetyltransferase
VIVKGKRKAEAYLGKRLSDPKYTGKKYFVLSETGERLFGAYDKMTGAKKRLGQVEFFKRRSNPSSQIESDYRSLIAGEMSLDDFTDRHDVKAVPKHASKGPYWGYDCGSHANQTLDKKYGGRGTWEYGKEGISWKEAKAGDYITWNPDSTLQLHQGLIIDPNTHLVESCWGVDGYVFQHDADNSPYGTNYRLDRIQARNPKRRASKKKVAKRRRNPEANEVSYDVTIEGRTVTAQAFVHGEPIGEVTLRMPLGMPKPCESDIRELQSQGHHGIVWIAVDARLQPGYRGKGIGKELYRRAFQDLADMKGKPIIGGPYSCYYPDTGTSDLASRVWKSLGRRRPSVGDMVVFEPGGASRPNPKRQARAGGGLAGRHLDQLAGGLADEFQPSDFDPKALAKGTKVEMEHTDDPRIAREIAMDHLTEHPDYYEALEKMESELEANPRKVLYIKPNKAAVKAAKRGLEAREKAPKSKKGGLDAMQAKAEGVGSGVLRARDIVAGKRVNAYQVKAFFDRHRGNYLKAKDKRLKPEESRAIQAWLIWGGDPLYKQATAAVEKDRKAKRKNPPPFLNPKGFSDRKHKWDEVLINKGGKRRTRKQILDYYLKNENKIWPYLKGQTVLVIFGRGRNDFVLRRKGPDGKYIKLTKLKGIDDPNSFEYWIYRRVIEFHPVITTKTSGLIWIDVDPYKKAQPKSMAKMQRQIRKAIPLMKRLLKDEFGVKRAYVWRSGKKDGGWHIEGDLPRKMNVDKMRIKLREALNKYFADDPSFTTSIAKRSQIRLDTTLTKTMGSLRAPYSYTVDGAQKLPVSVPGIAPALKPKKRRKAKRNPGTPGYYKGLASTYRDALVIGLETQVFNVSKRTMRALVKHGLAEVDQEFSDSANMELTPSGRIAARTIAENRYHGVERGDISPSLVAKMGWSQPDANPRKAKRNPELTLAEYEELKRRVTQGKKGLHVALDYDPIGVGGNRMVYKIEMEGREPFAFKADMGPKEVATQTKMEVDCMFDLNNPVAPEIYDHDDKNYRWLEMELLDPMEQDAESRSRFKRITGISWEDFEFAFEDIHEDVSPALRASIRKELVKSEKSSAFLDSVLDLVENCALSPYELSVIENWGSTQDGKRLKLLDLGG